MIRVAIADDHALVREGLRRLLSDDNLEVVGEAAAADEVLEVCRRNHAEVLVLDVSMPGGSFLETMRALRDALPTLRILVVSMHAEERYAVRALRAGAAGYLSKTHGAGTLCEAIRHVHAGGRFITATVAEALAQCVESGGEVARHEMLSARELEVLLLLGAGRNQVEIGQRLDISPKTVSTYRFRIFEKMGFHTMSDLVLYVDHEMSDG